MTNYKNINVRAKKPDVKKKKQDIQSLTDISSSPFASKISASANQLH